MQLNKVDDLINKYPELLRNLSWGIECGDGWYDLLNTLFDELYDYKYNGLVIDQVKEKFGTLRVYYHINNISLNDEELESLYTLVDSLIDEAEKKSMQTCEACGQEGEFRNNGWMYMRCKKCWDEIKGDLSYE